MESFVKSMQAINSTWDERNEDVTVTQFNREIPSENVIYIVLWWDATKSEIGNVPISRVHRPDKQITD